MVSISPKMSEGSIVRIIKSNTARDLKKQYQFLKNATSVHKVYGQMGILSV